MASIFYVVSGETEGLLGVNLTQQIAEYSPPDMPPNETEAP